MAIHGSQGILNGRRQPKPSNEYTVPRYRVTLVRDNRALPPSSPLNSSTTATAILRPLFAGLDREQFLVCGLDAKHAIIGVNIVSIGSSPRRGRAPTRPVHRDVPRTSPTSGPLTD